MTTTSSETPPNAAPTVMVPLTPMRRFLGKLNIVRPIFSLGKRTREHCTGSDSESYVAECHDPLAMAHQPVHRRQIASDNHKEEASILSGAEGCSTSDILVSPSQIVERACVAIQQEDTPLDAIVITTLPCYPFCCHEDLLLMSRQQLIDVSTTFNAHLPHVMRINISETVSNSQIRHCIERLAGIIPDIPAAPKRVRAWISKRPDDDAKGPPVSTNPQLDKIPSPPTSPLALRASRRRSFSLISTLPRMLERLEEEEEGEERPLKKRKVSDFKATPTRFLHKPTGTEMNISPARELECPISCERLVSSASILSPDIYSLGGERISSILRTSDKLDYRESNTKVLSLDSSMGVEDTTRMDVG